MHTDKKHKNQKDNYGWEKLELYAFDSNTVMINQLDSISRMVEAYLKWSGV